MAEPISDGQGTFLGGQDASKYPDRIPETAFAAGVNVNTANATITPRWSFEHRAFDFEGAEFTLPTLQKRLHEDIFHGGKFQGVAPYVVGEDEFFVIVVSGVVSLFNINTYTVKVLSDTGTFVDEFQDRVCITTAEKYLIIHDYPNYPLILDGIVLRRADPLLYEVPISVLSTYNQNRLFIADNGAEFTAGDPAGNFFTPEAPITFEEIEVPQALYLNQIFALPTAAGRSPITAMGFLALNDTSTGIGPLIVANENLIYSFQSQNPRTTWENSQFGSAYVKDYGIVGQRAFVNIGSDLFFMSSDGYVRSANMSRAEQGKYSRAPISLEVKNWLKFQDLELAKYTAFSNFKNKVFITCNPYRVKAQSTSRKLVHDYASLGFVSIAFDNASTLAGDSPPVWEGLWTGIRPMDFVSIRNRLFAISKDSESNEIWELNPDNTIDRYANKYRQIRSRLRGRQLVFQSPALNKDLHSLDLGITNLQGDIEIDVKYKPSHSPRFLPWRTVKRFVPWRNCGIPSQAFLQGYEGEAFRDLTIGTPKNITECNPVTNETFSTFKKIQVQLTITSKYFELNEYRLKAYPRQQSENQTNEVVCEEGEALAIPKACSDDWVTEDFSSCQQLKT